jgi:hypothetical protein
MKRPPGIPPLQGREDVNGGFSEAELRDAGALAVFESLDQLRRHLDETPLG